MAITTAPYGALEPAKFNTPFENLSQVVKMDDLRTKQREQAQAEADDAAMREILKTSVRSDGSPDIKGAIDKLTMGGHVKVAQGIQKGYDDHLKSVSEQMKLENETKTQHATIVAQALQGVKTAEQYAALAQLIPDIAKTVGPDFDPTKIERAIAAGTTVAEYNKQENAQIDRALKGEGFAATAGMLAMATDPESWDQAMHFGKTYGVSDAQLAQFGQFSEGNKARAAQLGLSLDKRADVQGQAEGRAVTMRGQDMSAQTAAAGQALTARGQNMTAQSAANRLAFDKGEAGKPGAAAKGGPNVANIITQIETLSKKINTSDGGPMSRVTGALRSGMAAGQMDNDVSEYNALVEGMIPMVARAVGHTGVLTQQDVDSVRALFPRVGDNKVLANNKLARVKSLIGGGAPAAAAPAAGGGADPLGIR